jgi:dipeptidyl aminopeptidase/acylaminoacyl peptidase
MRHLLLLLPLLFFPKLSFTVQTVTFPSGHLALKGVLYKPIGDGPFPAVLYNHGSAMDSRAAFEQLGPFFANRGWIFFAPYRREQGLSAPAGNFILNEIRAAWAKGGPQAGAAKMIELLQTEQLDDQMAALQWLKQQSFTSSKRIAVAGNSFGGIETILGAEKEPYCAAVDASGGSESWAQAPELQSVMKRAVQRSQSPIFFFQAENDYDLDSSVALASVMKQSGKPFKLRIYPPFGRSKQEGHSFAYMGISIFGEDVLRFLEQNCDKH